MSKNEVVGKTVWVTRRAGWADYIIWEKRPHWLTSANGWCGGVAERLTDVCPELFRRWLGARPPKHLREGGPKAIQRATLYVGLDWEGLK